MRTINFTRYAAPVSDFDAEATIAAHMRTLEIDEDAVVETCNLLIWQMLRAELINNSLKFETLWQFEGLRIDMDVHLRSGQFWQHPVTNLEEDALFKLVEPTTLRSNGEYS